MGKFVFFVCTIVLVIAAYFLVFRGDSKKETDIPAVKILDYPQWMYLATPTEPGLSRIDFDGRSCMVYVADSGIANNMECWEDSAVTSSKSPE